MTTRMTNPGEELYNWLARRYRGRSARGDSGSWIFSVARDFSMDQLEDYLFTSTLYMILRRLLANAAWYKDRYIDEDLAASMYEREYLLGVFGFVPEDRKHLRRLVFSAYATSKKDITQGTMKTVKEWAIATNQRCHIGGCVIDYNEVDPKHDYNWFTLDHTWPRSLGGSSEEWNLRVACKSCNQARQNIVNASDAHYEHFHVKVPPSSPSFLSELNTSFRFAALAASDYKCQICRDEVRVEDMDGGPQYFPKDKQEGLNMFNIVVGCDRHH